MPAPLPPNFSPRGNDAPASRCVVVLVDASRRFAESALDAVRWRFAADEAHLALVMAKRSEAERIARRLADKLARRGATEAEITTIVQEATR